MYGKLNWSELIEPSILLAEKGFRIGLSLADALKKERRTILKDENLR